TVSPHSCVHPCASFLPSMSLFASVPFFFSTERADPEIYTLSLHDALPICKPGQQLDQEIAAPHSHSGRAHSHSMVPGGLLVTSSVTRLTSGTSLVMRVEMRLSTS